jgi:DNA-binding XRE family transcriptional regulator|tara:strand:+ start:9536 stop:9775 length:240 start_codon:yes stop_codon:yes gene_type:complete
MFTQWEDGSRKPPMTLRSLGIADRRVRLLKPHEKCAVARWRSGKTQATVADAVGVSRYWIQLMEAGTKPCERLTEYWAA